MILTRGVSPTFSRDPRDAQNKLICFAIPFGWILRPEKRAEGLSVAISDIQRIPPESVDPRIKNYHWLDFVLGLYDAYERGAGTTVLQDAHGNLTEGPGFNIFVVKEGVISTPSGGVLQGITRRSAMELAAELGLPVEERRVPATELIAADEAFATSTAGGLMPITQVNGSTIADGRPGPITSQLTDAYWAKHFEPGWSESVDAMLGR